VVDWLVFNSRLVSGAIAGRWSSPSLSEGSAVPLFAAVRPSFPDLRLIYCRHQVLMVVVFSSRKRGFLYR